MKRLLLLPAIGSALFAGGVGAESGCIDESYDPLTGTSNRAIARPDLGVVLAVDPERPEPLWLGDPSRSILAPSR